MTIERKLTKTSGATSEAVYVEDVFSTWLYTGNGLYPSGGGQTIVNGINLAEKGGLIWARPRSDGNHGLYDTARGINQMLGSSSISEQYTDNSLVSANTNGFTLGDDSSGWGRANGNGKQIVSWTFRKQPKFFDIVTYTGTGSARTISHNLGSTPGMIIVKRTDTTGNWQVYHRGLGSTKSILLNLASGAATSSTPWNNTDPTSSVFTVGTNANGNASGGTYVAYLFAHDAGGFGAAGTDSVVSCGSFTTSGQTTVNLGWEPQYVLFKRANSSQDWYVFDNMRGMSVSNSNKYLLANSSAAEYSTDTSFFVIKPTATGFVAEGGWLGEGFDYIYLAIRRGPMKTPTDATKVFAPIASSASTGTKLTTSFPVDLQIFSGTAEATSPRVMDRLRGVSSNSTSSGAALFSDQTAAEDGASSSSRFWDNTGFTRAGDIFGAYNLPTIYWNFRRAPGFFDVVCYTGTGSATTVAHNLGVAPEIFIVKRRDAVGNWAVYSKFTTTSYSYQVLQIDNAGTNNKLYGVGGSPNFEELSSAPSATTINLASSVESNGSGRAYVAYLFATCPGVSKVGSYTGNGSSQTIDCGFTNGARFVLIKRTDSTGSWWVYDSARGIVSANDPALQLNSTAAEVTSADAVDPASSGFIVNQEATCNINVSSATYIYLSVA